jgi:hypothetical protein
MHILKAFEYLVDDVLLVDILEDVCANHSVQIRVHEVEHQVDVAVIFSAHHILESDDVFVAGEFLQEDDLAEGTLSIRRILESIEVLLECNDLLGPLVKCLPDNTVSSLS